MAGENFRIEGDSMGEVKVPSEAYYGAQTQRAVENFPVSGIGFPRQFIRVLDDPGWVSGRWISPMPQRGPEASQRKSLAIFIKLTASDFKLPLMCTAASRAAWAS
jgi:hypothetical protein